MSFEIITDATADMPAEFYDKTKIKIVPMPFFIDDTEYGTDLKISIEEFYNKIRNGAMPVTAQVKQFDALNTLDKALADGNDVLYLSFSSGISGSFDNMSIVRNELLEKYPDRKIILVDTLCGAGGEGLLVYYANKLKEEGKSMEEIASWCEENKLKFRHLFIVDDLTLLKKGGRISKIEALMGTILGIKPVLELNDKGKIYPVNKCMGRKKAIKAMVEYMRATIIFGENDFIGIGHGDCLDEALKLGEVLKKEFGVEKIVYTHVNELVGSHAGVGSLAVFFIGKKRENKSLLTNLLKTNEEK